MANVPIPSLKMDRPWTVLDLVPYSSEISQALQSLILIFQTMFLGLRLINEMDEMLIHAADSKRFHPMNHRSSRSRRESSSSDRDSVGESTAGHESSFESSESSGIGESIVSSTKNSIPILDFPVGDHTPRFFYKLLGCSTKILTKSDPEKDSIRPKFSKSSS